MCIDSVLSDLPNGLVHVHELVVLLSNADIIIRPQSTAVISHRWIRRVELIQRDPMTRRNVITSVA